MHIFKLIKMAFSFSPGWRKKVEMNGKACFAEILSDPLELMKGTMGNVGSDKWIDCDVRVEATDESPFQSVMKCKFSQASAGKMTIGQKVNVKYDPANKAHVLLIDDVYTLINYRKMKAAEKNKGLQGFGSK
jgi:hypothetical protein